MSRVDISDILDRAHVVALPMVVPFRGITTREALLIDGPVSWGEFAPFVEYGDAEAATWLAAALEAAYAGYDDMDIGDGWVEVNGTVPAVLPEQVPEVLERYPSARTFKIKVAEKGQTLDDDAARVNAVRTLRPDAALRVDANGGWTVDTAVRAAEVLGELEYIEQPCATAEELADVRRRVSTPIAADESIRKVSDPYRVAELGAADVAVAKVAPLGGVRRLMQISSDLGLRVTVASALDTAVGIHTGLIAAKAADSQAAGLATQRLFVEDVAEPFEFVDGRMRIADITPDPDRLAALAAPGERKDWWFERLRRCCTYLGD